MTMMLRLPGQTRSNKVMQRINCTGDDDRSAVVLECRYFFAVKTPRGPRVYPGAKQWRLATGDMVELIDADLFRLPATGELLMRTG